MNHYEAKLERKRLRLLDRAKTAASGAQLADTTARRLASFIPMGQPILVGHHSEKRHRRDLDRINRGFEKSWELSKKAGELNARAENLGKHGVSSDDPDAPDKLAVKLAGLEELHAKMKAANKLVKKGDVAALTELMGSEKVAAELLKPDFCGRLGFPAYAISNSNANIKRVKDRIAHLERMATTAAIEPITGTIEGIGFTISEDLDDNRILIEFESRTSKELYKRLRSSGFVWSPTRTAFVRQRSTTALWNAKTALGLPQ